MWQTRLPRINAHIFTACNRWPLTRLHGVERGRLRCPQVSGPSHQLLKQLETLWAAPIGSRWEGHHDVAHRSYLVGCLNRGAAFSLFAALPPFSVQRVGQAKAGTASVRGGGHLACHLRHQEILDLELPIIVCSTLSSVPKPKSSTKCHVQPRLCLAYPLNKSPVGGFCTALHWLEIQLSVHHLWPFLLTVDYSNGLRKPKSFQKKINKYIEGSSEIRE